MKSSFTFIQNKDLLAIAIITLVTVFFWIGFETYSTISGNKTPNKSQLTSPINPTVQESVLQKLEASQP